MGSRRFGGLANLNKKTSMNCVDLGRVSGAWEWKYANMMTDQGMDDFYERGRRGTGEFKT